MTVTTAELRTLERKAHRALAVVEAMSPEEPGVWHQLAVSECSVTINEAGSLPGRSVRVVTPESSARMASLTVLGSWLRVRQDLTFWDLAHHYDVSVPWGYFRVDQLGYGLDGTVTVVADDAGAVISSAKACTLAEKTIPKGKNIVGKIGELIAAVWPAGGIYRFAPQLLDSSLVTDRAETTVGKVIDEDREVIVQRLASELRAVLVPAVDGAAIYRLVPRSQLASSGITISRGQAGNLVDKEVTFDRESIVNELHVVWQGEKPASAGGGVGIIEQKRNVVRYIDPDSPVRADGPFGIQSDEVSSNDISTEAAALDAGRQGIIDTLSWSHDHDVTVSPIYGVDSGMQLHVEGIGGYTVVKGDIDLLGEWRLTLRRTDGTVTDPSPIFDAGRVVHEELVSDSAQWTGLRVDATKLDTNLTTAKGWSVDGGTLTAKDGRLTIIASSTTVTLRTVDVLPVPKLRRVRVTFRTAKSTLNGKGRGFTASAGIRYGGNVYTDGQFGFPAVDGPDVSRIGEAVDPSADQQLPVAADPDWGATLRFYKVAVGQKLVVDSVAFEQAGRPKP